MLVKRTYTKSTCPWCDHCSGMELKGSHIVEDDTSRPSQSGKPFSEEVGAVLESLYRRGMIDWGRKHSQDIESAVASSSLQLSQVNVMTISLCFLVELD